MSSLSTALIALFFPLARLLLIIFDIFLEGPVAGSSSQILATGVHGKEVVQEEHIAREEKTNVDSSDVRERKDIP